MDINVILKQIDECYTRHKPEEAEALMQAGIRQAVLEQDDESLLQLLNELLGHYRETSQVENSFAIAAQAVAQAERMGLQDSIPYATTLLNAANAYRAGGRLKDSMNYYLQVRDMYERMLAPDNMLVASLENNLSLLYQEMGRFQEAKACLLKALAIVQAKGEAFEEAVTYANLAGTCMQTGEPEEAYGYACKGRDCFDAIGVADSHYCAVLSALGTYHYKKGEYGEALRYFEQAVKIMEQDLGQNEAYHRLQENAESCRKAMGGRAGDMGPVKGLELCEEYYEIYGRPMIEQQFGDYAGRIAVGLAGKGSDCFGYDDAQSRDHDWGPDFCMWVTAETYAEIGEKLQAAYEQLPAEFKGYRRTVSPWGRGRRGVFTIDGFFEMLLGAASYEKVDWRQVSDASLAAAVNGRIFRDDEGIFTQRRQEFCQGYPEPVMYLKLADAAARFSQCGQYNYKRVLQREDWVSAQLMLADCMREAMKLQHYIEGKYPPHDKWLYRSLCESERGRELGMLLRQLVLRRAGKDEKVDERSRESTVALAQSHKAEELIEEIAAFFVGELYERGYISDSDNYLDAHTEELLQKSSLAAKSNEELVEEIAKLEFEAFDKVKNEGGRASCQNDWATFSIMRKSQYLTWNRLMLLQYLYDFYREYRRGHNLITEKYGRMMESTAPEEYERIKDNFPVLSPEKKAIIEQITGMQVGWMEEFAGNYPHLADNARSIHASEDSLYNTSYETYLRGELGTYSDKMLELYGRYVVQYARENRNLTYDIMTNSVHLYGYAGLEEAEKFLS